MRRLGVFVLMLATPALAHLSAQAVTMAPAPSKALLDRPLGTAIQGIERLTAKPIPRRLPRVPPLPSPSPDPCHKFPVVGSLCGNTAAQAPDEVPAGNDGAECHFCLVGHQMTWWDYGDREELRVDHQEDVAKELIDTLHVHGAFLRIPAGISDCYSDQADYVYIKGADSAGPTDSLRISSNGTKYSGKNNRWTLTIGAQFWDDYGYWELLGGEIDMCKQF